MSDITSVEGAGPTMQDEIKSLVLLMSVPIVLTTMSELMGSIQRPQPAAKTSDSKGDTSGGAVTGCTPLDRIMIMLQEGKYREAAEAVLSCPEYRRNLGSILLKVAKMIGGDACYWLCFTAYVVKYGLGAVDVDNVDEYCRTVCFRKEGGGEITIPPNLPVRPM